MAFVDQMPQVQLDVPHESGEFFLVRQLGWRELEECRRVRAMAQVEAAKAVGSEMLAQLQAMEESAAAGTEEDSAALEAAKARQEATDARDQFDKDTLISRSVMGWSYGYPFSKVRLEQLDEKTAKWLFGAIADLYVGAEDVAAQGEGSTPSTGF